MPPAFLSEQQQSRENLRRGQSESGLNLQTVRAFKAITDEEVQVQAKSKPHQSLLSTLQKQASKKRSLLESLATGCDPEARAQLEAHRQEAAAKLNTKLVRRDLKTASCKLVYKPHEHQFTSSLYLA